MVLGKASESASSSQEPMPLPVPPAMECVMINPCRLSQFRASRSAAANEMTSQDCERSLRVRDTEVLPAVGDSRKPCMLSQLRASRSAKSKSDNNMGSGPEGMQPKFHQSRCRRR